MSTKISFLLPSLENHEVHLLLEYRKGITEVLADLLKVKTIFKIKLINESIILSIYFNLPHDQTVRFNHRIPSKKGESVSLLQKQLSSSKIIIKLEGPSGELMSTKIFRNPNVIL